MYCPFWPLLNSKTFTWLIIINFFFLAEKEEREEKEHIKRETESKCVELVTSQSVRVNHVTWGDDLHRQQPHHPPAPPPPSLPPQQVPIAVIPMVPVVTATPSVPAVPLTTQIAAAATSLNSSASAKNAASLPQQQHQQSSSRHLLCATHIKVETSPQQIDVKPSVPQPQVQIQYPTSISTNGSGSQHALVPHQVPPASQPRPNGVTMEDMRGMEGKRRPGGSVYLCLLKLAHEHTWFYGCFWSFLIHFVCRAGTREVHNKLEKNRLVTVMWTSSHLLL